MNKIWELQKDEIKKIKKDFYNTDYGRYLLKDIIGGFISIIFLLFISGIFVSFDKIISLIFLVFAFIISFFVILEYFRVEYILFEKYLMDLHNKK